MMPIGSSVSPTWVADSPRLSIRSKGSKKRIPLGRRLVTINQALPRTEKNGAYLCCSWSVRGLIGLLRDGQRAL